MQEESVHLKLLLLLCNFLGITGVKLENRWSGKDKSGKTAPAHAMKHWGPQNCRKVTLKPLFTSQQWPSIATTQTNTVVVAQLIKVRIRMTKCPITSRDSLNNCGLQAN